MSRLSAIAERVEDELARILDETRAQTPGLAGLIDELERVIGAGGKRLRPTLCVMGYRAVTDQADERIFAAAASLELLHTFALLHDDVMDGSMTRRGIPSTLASKGAPVAILAGDLAFALSDQVFAESGFPQEAIGRARQHLDMMRTNAIAGQYLEMNLAGKQSLDQKDASKIARLKTGSYTVEGPLAVGAALGGADAAAQVTLATFAAPIGEAFQLMDDLEGIEPGATDGAADLRAGAPTYVVATALALATAAQRTSILAAWGVEKASDEKVEVARKALVECGAADMTLQRAASLIKGSREVLEASHGRCLKQDALIVLNEIAASILEGRVRFAGP